MENNNRKKIAVHCKLGMSRAPALMVGYLMYRDKTSYEAAFKKVNEKRSCVSPNAEFIQQLKSVEFMM